MASEDTAGFRNWLALALGGASVEALGGVVTRGGPKKDWAPALFEGEALGGALSKTTVALSNAAQLILDGLYRRNAALRTPPPPEDTAAEHGGGAWARCWRQPGGTALLTGSFGCLFFTALAPHGPVLTAFLATRGVDPRAIAVFRTLGAFAGIGGIYAFGKAADGCCAAVGAAAALAAAYGPGAVPGLAAFMAAVVLSRAGLYAYDVGYLELQQLLVDERDRGACQGVEAALCGGNELLLALVTLCFFHDPRDFGALAALSALFVGLALALFAAWAALYHVHDHDHGRGDHPHEHTPQQAKALDESGAKRHVHVHRADHGAHDHGHGHHDHGHDRA
ncbi:RING finger ubiquitin ligase [Aureococcus anophagefferens]|nr:RING finger ubiquitin ligase [Aureococcus anophagefferens]